MYFFPCILLYFFSSWGRNTQLQEAKVGFLFFKVLWCQKEEKAMLIEWDSDQKLF